MPPIERVQSDPTAWWWFYGVTAAQITQTLTQNNARIVDLQVESLPASGGIFSVAMVANTGPYAKEWWWFFGLSEQALNQKLSQLNARLISISPFQDPSGDLVFGAVMVSNTGADAKEWWWYFGPAASVEASLKPLNARVVDLEPYTFNGQTNYAAIAIANTGTDAASWWWWFDISAANLSTQLTQNSAQVLTLCHDGSGFDATLQAPSSAEWWYYYGLNAQAVSDNFEQNGARLTQVRAYPGPVFDVVMINNSDAFTTRIGNILRGNGAGWNGFYLKQLNGPVIGAINDQRAFEPASCIKIVIALYAMQKVQAGTAHLTDWVALLFLDEPSYCANKQMSLGAGNGTTTTFTGSVILPANNGAPILPGSIRIAAGSVSANDNGSGVFTGTGVSGTINYTTGAVSVTFQHAPPTGIPVLVYESLRGAISQMMQNSDDARTDMFLHLYGLSTLTTFANSLGMTHTKIASYINCTFTNALTLDDAAILYTGLANATLLTAANVQLLFSMMAGKDYDFSGIWGSLKTIIQQEAAPFNLTAQQIAVFENGIQLSQKSGGYTWPGGITAADGNTIYSSGGNIGWVKITSCDGKTQISTQYIFGFLGEYTAPNSNTWAAMGAGAEILRETVRAALSTWSQCG